MNDRIALYLGKLKLAQMRARDARRAVKCATKQLEQTKERRMEYVDAEQLAWRDLDWALQERDGVPEDERRSRICIE